MLPNAKNQSNKECIVTVIFQLFKEITFSFPSLHITAVTEAYWMAYLSPKAGRYASKSLGANDNMHL